MCVQDSGLNEFIHLSVPSGHNVKYLGKCYLEVKVKCKFISSLPDMSSGKGDSDMMDEYVRAFTKKLKYKQG